MQPKQCPFTIPLVRYGKVLSTWAVIDSMTSDRVSGNLSYMNWAEEPVFVPFNVKHDGKGFAVGSDSSKQRFYFKNWNKTSEA